LRVRLTPEAVADVSAARAWYVRQRPGLGRELTTTVNQALNALQESFPLVNTGTRRVLLRRFPYAIYYHIDGEVIVVLACVHGARDPEVWQRRLD